MWSRDEHDPRGPLVLKRVEELFRRLAKILHLHAGGRVIRTTAEHPFYAKGTGWTPAGALRAGDEVWTDDGRWVGVEEVYDTGEYEPVYNLRVADFHTYFVGDDGWGWGLWAHNLCVGNYQHVSDALRNGKGGGRGTGSRAKQVHHLNLDAIYGLEHGVPNGIPYRKGAATPLVGRTSTGGTEHRAFHVKMDTWLSQYMPGGSKAGKLPTNAEYHVEVINALKATTTLSTKEIYKLADSARRQRRSFGFEDGDDIPQLPQTTPLANKEM